MIHLDTHNNGDTPSISNKPILSPHVFEAVPPVAQVRDYATVNIHRSYAVERGSARLHVSRVRNLEIQALNCRQAKIYLRLMTAAVVVVPHNHLLVLRILAGSGIGLLEMAGEFKVGELQSEPRHNTPHACWDTSADDKGEDDADDGEWIDEDIGIEGVTGDLLQLESHTVCVSNPEKRR